MAEIVTLAARRPRAVVITPPRDRQIDPTAAAIWAGVAAVCIGWAVLLVRCAQLALERLV